MAQEWFLTQGSHSEFEYWTADSVIKKAIPARLILAKIVDGMPYPAEIVVNTSSELFGMATDAVTILEKIEHDRSNRGGYEDFGSVENAIAHFERYGSKVEIEDSFNDIVAALATGILGTASEKSE
ncbi:MAG: hypothetical protein ABI758_07065 [Candidatus Woesebacteria bacterium]